MTVPVTTAQISIARGHAENRNKVFPEQPGTVACYRHEKFNASLDSDINDFPNPARAADSHIKAVRRMAATGTRDTFGTCLSQIAIDPYAAAIGVHRKCARLGGATMITISIFWALVFALFTTKDEQPTTSGSKQ
jgi:hypothetical protein